MICWKCSLSVPIVLEKVIENLIYCLDEKGFFFPLDVTKKEKETENACMYSVYICNALLQFHIHLLFS